MLFTSLFYANLFSNCFRLSLAQEGNKVEELCEYCLPAADVKSEYEEWLDEGTKKAAEIIKNIKQKEEKQ